MHQDQHPIGSGFTAFSTTQDVIEGIDLTGRRAIVTGGYSGLGLETARTLSDAGAEVIVPARDVERAAGTVRSIRGVDVRFMDLLDPDSIDRFAADIVSTGEPVHILVGSAGVMAIPTLKRDTRGNELQLSTNHLGHYQLMRRLWPALALAKGARVVLVSSMGHRFSDFNFDDPNFLSRAYDPWGAYGQSKTANILTAVEGDRRGVVDGIRCFALHPGAIYDTGLGIHVPVEDLKAGGYLDDDGNPIIDPARGLKTLEQGAATQVWCATSPTLNQLGGLFCENCDISPVLMQNDAFSLQAEERHSPGVKAYAIDPDAARRLWEASGEMLSIEA